MKRGPKPRRNPYDRLLNPHQTKFVAEIIRRVDSGKVDREVNRDAHAARKRRRVRVAPAKVETPPEPRKPKLKPLKVRQKSAAEEKVAAAASRAVAKAAARAALKADALATKRTAALAAERVAEQKMHVPEGTGRCSRPGCHHYSLHHGALPEDVVTDRCSVMGCECPSYLASAAVAS